ncbi:MAG: NYN domain-containing protein [Cyanosarcina radialis HA8281-LM2]|jgi:uncharacterized LabA/DUF88 family protein/uncharacterized coiled-coil protein SlyX|nr:NYN domain-containing protein [Cyanosarcina radialis HA8281-LM2]
MSRLPLYFKQRYCWKKTSFLTAAVLMAILEKSFFPLLLLLPLARQEQIARQTSNQVAAVEKQSVATSQQLRTLTRQLESSESETQKLAKKVRTQQTSQRLNVGAIQKLQHKDRVIQQQIQQTLSGIDRLSKAIDTTPKVVEPATKPRSGQSIFIDSANLDGASRALKIDIDYAKLKTLLSAASGPVSLRFYIGEDPSNQLQKHFFNRLRKLGYTVVPKTIVWQQGKPKANVDVDLAVDMIQLGMDCETVVLCSGDGDYLKAVNEVKKAGVKVVVVGLGSQTSHLLKQAASEYIDLAEIKESIAFERELAA